MTAFIQSLRTVDILVARMDKLHPPKEKSHLQSAHVQQEYFVRVPDSGMYSVTRPLNCTDHIKFCSVMLLGIGLFALLTYLSVQNELMTMELQSEIVSNSEMGQTQSRFQPQAQPQSSSQTRPSIQTRKLSEPVRYLRTMAIRHKSQNQTLWLEEAILEEWNLKEVAVDEY